MRIILISVVVMLVHLCLLSGAYALNIDLVGETVSEDFNNYRGEGLASSPIEGQLDSDDWRVSGLSDGSSTFGNTQNSGDFARGTSDGGVSRGGLYAFDIDNNSGSTNYALGVQPGGNDFTDGSLTLQLFNNTGVDLTSLIIEYDVFVYNDQNRSNSLGFSYSYDDLAYVDISDADVVSPTDRSVLPEWVIYSQSFSLDNIEIGMESFFLKWSGDDVGGTRSRDEFALDNLRITGYSTPDSTSPVPEPSSIFLIGSGLIGLMILRKGKH